MLNNSIRPSGEDSFLLELSDDCSVLPIQYYDIISRSRVCAGERRLMLAVLEDAIRCYLNNMNHPSPENQEAFVEVKEWFNAIDGQGAFAYRNLCEALDIEPDNLKRQLESIRTGHLEEAANMEGIASHRSRRLGSAIRFRTRHRTPHSHAA
ncbi:MAG: hypothetical protein ACREP6_04895 [Candidatus Binataceae bacterium]